MHASGNTNGDHAATLEHDGDTTNARTLADALDDVRRASESAGSRLPAMSVATLQVIQLTYRISGDVETTARNLHALADAIRTDAGVER